MTGFDYAAGFLLLVSGVVGLIRGATREITTVLALVAAAVVSIVALRFTGPIARHAIHAVWLANTVAVLCGFIVAYVIFRLIGGLLARRVQDTALSGLDRVLGFGIGLVRALVVLGGFTLLINAAMPPERMPAWIADAKLYPVASAAGAALRAFAPKGLKMAKDVAPALEGTMGQDSNGADDRTAHHSDSPQEDPR